MNHNKEPASGEPFLGLATTEQLLEEIAVRMEITPSGYGGDKIGKHCREALERLSLDVLHYRTIDVDAKTRPLKDISNSHFSFFHPVKRAVTRMTGIQLVKALEALGVARLNYEVLIEVNGKWAQLQVVTFDNTVKTIDLYAADKPAEPSSMEYDL